MEDTREEIHRSGHRRFVGGNDEFWDLIRELQFRFLVERGLAPSDTFIDVACGSLRGGVNFIRYLEPGRYLGIDKYIELVYGFRDSRIGSFALPAPGFPTKGEFTWARQLRHQYLR